MCSRTTDISDLFWMAMAGVGAGFVNTVVGSGSLISFPTLVWFGLPPVAANVTNNLGLVFGGLSGTWGYREELRGSVGLLRWLMPVAGAGALAGALLLLGWPNLFAVIVPVLIGIAVLLVVLQPTVRTRVLATGWRPPAFLLGTGVGLTAVYGGYFGAAQGVLLLGVLGLLLPHDLQKLNAVKNALQVTANMVAAVVFLVVAPDQVVGSAAVAVAVGAAIGGGLGARYGRRLSAPVLRGFIVVVGVIAIGVLIGR